MTQEKEQLKELIWNVHVLNGITEATTIHSESLRQVFNHQQKMYFNRMILAQDTFLKSIRKVGLEDLKDVEENADNLGGDMLDLIYDKFRPDFEELEAIKKL